MSDKLKPCPVCGGENVRIDEHQIFCLDDECNFYTDPGWWQSLPRRDETAAEIARELEIAFEVGNEFDAHINRDWILDAVARLRAIAAPEEVDGVAQHRIKNLMSANTYLKIRAEKAEAERDGWEKSACAWQKLSEEFRSESQTIASGPLDHWRNEYKTLEMSDAMAVEQRDNSERDDLQAALDRHCAECYGPGTLEKAEADKAALQTAIDSLAESSAAIRVQRDESTARLAALEAAVGTVCRRIVNICIAHSGENIPKRYQMEWLDALRSALKSTTPPATKGTEQIPGPICRSCSLDNVCDACLEDVEVSWRLCDGCYQELKSTPPPPKSGPSEAPVFKPVDTVDAKIQAIIYWIERHEQEHGK